MSPFLLFYCSIDADAYVIRYDPNRDIGGARWPDTLTYGDTFIKFYISFIRNNFFPIWRVDFLNTTGSLYTFCVHSLRVVLGWKTETINDRWIALYLVKSKNEMKYDSNNFIM